jgi:hypothetical protein
MQQLTNYSLAHTFAVTLRIPPEYSKAWLPRKDYKKTHCCHIMSIISTVTFTNLYSPLSNKTSAVCVTSKTTYKQELKNCLTDIPQ